MTLSNSHTTLAQARQTSGANIDLIQSVGCERECRESDGIIICCARLVHVVGGDAYTTVYNSEVHSVGSNMYVYKSLKGGNGRRLYEGVVRTSLLVRISRFRFYATNYEGFNRYVSDRGLFYYNWMWLGINRVVHYKNSFWAYDKRYGSGLCSVCVFFHRQNVYQIDVKK